MKKKLPSYSTWYSIWALSTDCPDAAGKGCRIPAFSPQKPAQSACTCKYLQKSIKYNYIYYNHLQIDCKENCQRFDDFFVHSTQILRFFGKVSCFFRPAAPKKRLLWLRIPAARGILLPSVRGLPGSPPWSVCYLPPRPLPRNWSFGRRSRRPCRRSPQSALWPGFW